MHHKPGRITNWAAVAALFITTLCTTIGSEYDCDTLAASNLSGKTVWIYPLDNGFLAHPDFDGRGYSSLVLKAGGAYTMNAANAAYARNGTWTATNGFGWVDVWLNNFPETGASSKVVLFSYCSFELERFAPTFTNIYSGNFRVTDGGTPSPQPPTGVTIGGGGASREVGSTVNLSVQADGDTPFTYTWTGPGGVIAGANMPTLVLTNVQLSDSGNYTCTVANAYGTKSASTSITVIPGTAPSVTVQPQSRGSNLGNSFFLNVTAGGSVPRHYQWRKEGVKIAGATSDALYFPSFSAADLGNYDVVVTNSFGSITSTVATLTLYSGPVIASLTPHLDITNGQAFTVSVTATGDAPMYYQWFRNGTAITGATTNSYTGTGTSNTRGAYTVKIQNAAATVTSEPIYVVAWYPDKAWPAIALDTNYTSAASVVVTQGQTLRLVGIASAPTPITFTWRRNDANIPGFTDVPADFISYQASGNSSTRYSYLTIPNAQADTAGAYKVVTTNPFGVATSSVASVTVLLTSPPVLLTQPTNRTLYLGTTLTVPLTLSYAGSLPTTVNWYSNNVLLPGVTGANASVQIKTAGEFIFHGVASNTFGAVTTSNAVVTVKYGDGRVDDFSTRENFSNYIMALAPLTNGGVMVAGPMFTMFGSTSIRGVAIVNVDGTLNPWRAAANSTVGTLSDVYALHRYPDGRVLVGGYFSRVGTSPGRQYSGLARLNADGTVDTSFLAGWDSANQFIGVSAASIVKSIAVAPDGTIAVGGTFTTVSDTPVSGLAFFDANGQFKTAQRPVFAAADISVLKYQPDGKLLVGGNFTTLDGQQQVCLARLKADGTRDVDFSGGASIFDSAVKCLDLDAAGNIYAGGEFNSAGKRGIVRLFPNGGHDTSFISEISSGRVSSIRVQPDGRVIIGGLFYVSGLNRLARLEKTGATDLTFPGGGIEPSSGEVLSMEFAHDGRLWVAGSFYGFLDPFRGGNYATRQFLARLEFFSAPSVTPPLLGSVFVTAGNLGFTVPTVSGVTYRVEYVETLGSTNWLTYSTFPGTGATVPVSIPTLGSQKFFRLVAVP